MTKEEELQNSLSKTIDYYEKYINDVIQQTDAFPVAHQLIKTNDGMNEYNVRDSSINFTNANVKENEIYNNAIFYDVLCNRLYTN